MVDLDDEADEEGVVNVLSSDPDEDPDAGTYKWVVKHDIIGNPMRMVAVPTHFFKVGACGPWSSPAGSDDGGSFCSDWPTVYSVTI